MDEKASQRNMIYIFCAIGAIAAIMVYFSFREQFCYERLTKDFKSAREWAESPKTYGDNTLTWQDYRNYAKTALESELDIFVIYRDNDQNACNFYSDGPQLRRK